MAKNKNKMRKKANYANLKWSDEDDQPAIEAVREVAKVLGYNFKETLRWICVHTKSHAVEKANQIQKLLKAS